MIRRFHRQSTPVIKMNSDVPVHVLSEDWDEAEAIMNRVENSILIIDESADYLKTRSFAGKVKGSSNYFLIISRSPLYMLPYSVNEVYAMVGDRKVEQRQHFHTLRQLYEIKPLGEKYIPDAIIVEDSNSGYEFFKETVREGIEILSAGGRDNIVNMITKFEKNTKLVVIVDGAACGATFGDIISSLTTCEYYLVL